MRHILAFQEDQRDVGGAIKEQYKTLKESNCDGIKNMSFCVIGIW